MTDPKLLTDEHRNRGTANRTAESRQHSMTAKHQAERFERRRQRDRHDWNERFAGTGVEWREQPE